MSTKNLARTVVEGGRRSSNTSARRGSHAQLRSAVRARMDDVRRDPALADERPWPALRSVPRRFADKLSAAEEWMKSQVGRPWDRVRGEMLGRFDTRTVAGRHLVFAHLLPQDRDKDGTWHVDRQYFRVDRHGALRLAPPARKRTPPVPESVNEELRALVGDRRVAVRGGSAYWLVPVLRSKRPTEQNAPQRYRQDAALDEAERAQWDAFPARARKWWTVKLA